MIVGLTGGIGSGKTTVAQIFMHLKVPVFVADEVSKTLLDTNKTLQNDLQQLLGPELMKQGRLDKAYMAQRIFSDKALLQKVNALIHPEVGKAFKAWHAQQTAAFVIREAAILFESGTYHDCDKIIVVTAPEHIRLKRVVERSGETEEQVKQRMAKQWPQEQKERLADYLIINDYSQPVIPQVLKIYEDIIRSTNARS